jgi:adenine C2-methylase RlmN of 23S rRNA A2503 and tRNA A37
MIFIQLVVCFLSPSHHITNHGRSYIYHISVITLISKKNEIKSVIWDVISAIYGCDMECNMGYVKKCLKQKQLDNTELVQNC